MGRITLPDIFAKAGLNAADEPRAGAASAAAQAVLPQLIVMTPVAALPEPAAAPDAGHTGAKTTRPKKAGAGASLAQRAVGFLKRYPFGIAAVFVLAIAVPAILLGSSYWSAHHIKPVVASSFPVHRQTQPRGPNIAMPAGQLSGTLQQITTQPISLVVGAKSVPVDSATIKSWLHIVTDKQTGTSYIHLNEKDIAPSLDKLTSKYAKAPVNQVSVTHPDGTSLVVVGGRDGVNVGDVKALATQLAPTVLAGKGMQLNVPLQPVPFQAVTAATFDKLIEVNVNTHQMYLYDKGNFTRQYAISAGAPATPTPIGQFKVYAKYASQDMKGNNPDGSKYLQPHVPWINYFLPGGYAVHGNYWRPASVFGTTNTSHGCVSLPVDQAKWVYDWTPIGTTVIVHT